MVGGISCNRGYMLARARADEIQRYMYSTETIRFVLLIILCAHSLLLPESGV